MFFICFLCTANAQQITAYYQGNAKQIDQYPVEKLNRIIFSFCHLEGNRLKVDNHADTLTILKLVSLKKKNPSLKVLISLGGWGGCKTCSAVFSEDSSRREFAESVLRITNYFHTDGIDIDWEFPSLSAYPGHSFLENDKLHLNLLVKSLRETLGATKEISVLCAGFSPYLEGSIDLPGLISYVDHINLMTYDLIGSKVKRSGHQSSLYSTGWQESSADHALRHLDSLKIPHDKIAIGAAFYARLYQVLGNPPTGLNQPAEFKRFVAMKKIRTNYSDAMGYQTFWDPEAKASYKYNPRNGVYLTYDDEQSIAAKCDYTRKKGLSGVFFWELTLDRPRNGLLDALAQELRK